MGTRVYAATKAAKEKLAKGDYKKKCVKGCGCKTSARSKPEDKKDIV